jgi:formylmethanofuran dehydrogenase subunit E
MTLLEVHRCDVCGELFYVPEDPLIELKLINANETIIDYDLCCDCKEKFMKWILAVREGKTP